MAEIICKRAERLLEIYTEALAAAHHVKEHGRAADPEGLP